jgi:protein phosphatase
LSLSAPGRRRVDPASRIQIPDPSLVVLVGAAGSGKTTFAARHFSDGEILSSDAFRERLSGDAADQRRTRTVFSILHREAARRLAAGRLVVVDATNVERHARRGLVARARSAGLPAIAIVLDLPPDLVHAQNAGRAGRVVPPAVVDRHLERLREALAPTGLAIEGFAAIHVLHSAGDVDAAVVELRPTG